MNTSPQSAEEDIRLLDELSGLAMALARDLQACALAATDTGEKTGLALSFQRTARSVRQSIALKAQMERDRARLAREAREDQATAQRATVALTKAHMARVRQQTKHIAWDELEPRDAMAALADLDAILDDLAMADDFCSVPPHVHAARLCEELGIFMFGRSGESASGDRDVDSPDPDPASGPPPPRHESSG